ncbi:MAG: hypothetical protein HQ485_03965 [Acidobacteria bacterium]|nr:hypothetical protein [Acidobacteriota bacterium]
MTPLLVTLARRIGRLLARHGVSDGRDGVDVADPWADEMPTLAGLAAASVRGMAALGLRAGMSVRPGGDDRFASVGQDRLRVTPDGQVVPTLRPEREPPLPLDVDADPVWVSGG